MLKRKVILDVVRGLAAVLAPFFRVMDTQAGELKMSRLFLLLTVGLIAVG